MKWSSRKGCWDLKTGPLPYPGEAWGVLGPGQGVEQVAEGGRVEVGCRAGAGPEEGE